MTAWPGFAGGTVLAPTPGVLNELSINVWPHTLPAQTGKAPRILLGAPGLAVDTDLLTGQPVRAVLHHEGRTFAVSGDGLFERFAPGAFLRRGTVPDEPRRAVLVSNGLGGTQLLVLAGGQGFVLNLATNAWSPITSADFPREVRHAAYLDGLFLILTASGQWFLSAADDGTTWDASDVASRAQAADQWRTLLMATPNVWLLGAETSEIWYNSNAPDFPFSPIPQVFLEAGIEAPDSAALVAGAVCWIGRSRDGDRQVWQGIGTALSAIGDPILPALSTYARVDDAIGWGEVVAGHPWYVITFPTADVTWVWDRLERAWHQRADWQAGAWHACRARCHTVIPGENLHLVGSRQTGLLYQQSLDLVDQAGDDLRWLRQPPRVWAKNRRLFHHRIELYAQAGLGGPSSAPIDLEWSDDGGYHWSQLHAEYFGAVGAYRHRIRWQRLGMATDRVYRFSGSAPVRRGLFEASLDAMAGVA